ncbi:unnamed protein product, partial [Meganyctiphanes norvegica]
QKLCLPSQPQSKHFQDKCAKTCGACKGLDHNVARSSGMGPNGDIIYNWSNRNNKAIKHVTHMEETSNYEHGTTFSGKTSVGRINQKVYWYVGGGVILVVPLLLGLVYLGYLLRQRKRRALLETNLHEAIGNVPSRRGSVHVSENSLYGAVTGLQNDAPGEVAPGQDVPGQYAPGQDAPGQDAPGQDAAGQRGSDHDSVNSLYGVIMNPGDLTVQ